MSVLFLVPLALGMGAIGLVAFMWALQHNQFDDPEGAGLRVLDSTEGPKINPGKEGDRYGKLVAHTDHGDAERGL
ncbi:cbb3-type cytochrome oxidase assembly protein CcoS [Bauldia litoralis]|uniref:cbb3-type cytochrome oxidase assembly protein CcoS n=1 Tax=Bauldia litoralis TaxID=665467 RepID=UPI00326757B7